MPDSGPYTFENMAVKLECDFYPRGNLMVVAVLLEQG